MVPGLLPGMPAGIQRRFHESPSGAMRTLCRTDHIGAITGDAFDLACDSAQTRAAWSALAQGNQVAHPYIKSYAHTTEQAVLGHAGTREIDRGGVGCPPPVALMTRAGSSTWPSPRGSTVVASREH